MDDAATPAKGRYSGRLLPLMLRLYDVGAYWAPSRVALPGYLSEGKPVRWMITL